MGGAGKCQRERERDAQTDSTGRKIAKRKTEGLGMYGGKAKGQSCLRIQGSVLKC